MKISISHIPENKQKEISIIVDIIKSMSKKEKIIIDMIILFGSYARGDFVIKDLVSEGNNTLEYKSDFDILIVTRRPAQEKNLSFSREISKNINSNYTISSPVSILIEDIHHINARLEENRYFYLDVKREGILLYDSEKFKLKNAKVLSKEETLNIKKEDYDMWFGSAEEFFIDYKNAFNRGSYKIAVFYLHQVAERYITSYLLVKTGYKPKSHDLEVLYVKIIEENNKFDNWFNEKEIKYFELLRKAYVDSRYSKDYKISKEELVFIENKISILKCLVFKLCKEELK